jgi:hypothetical protein
MYIYILKSHPNQIAFLMEEVFLSDQPLVLKIATSRCSESSRDTPCQFCPATTRILPHRQRTCLASMFSRLYFFCVLGHRWLLSPSIGERRLIRPLSNSLGPWPPTAQPIQAFQATAGGKGLSLVHWALPWVYNGAYLDFPVEYANAVRSYGAIPVLDWSS